MISYTGLAAGTTEMDVLGKHFHRWGHSLTVTH